MECPTTITAIYIRSILDYSPETGVFIWKYRPDMPNNWNGNYSGKVAGYKTKNGYIRIGINGERYLAHRLAWLYVHGDWPNIFIDHADCDRANNRIANLRLATVAQNGFNRKTSKNNTSGIKGVHLSHGLWKSQIKVSGKLIHLGYYKCRTAAAFAYSRAARKHYGEFARVA